jgi:hypothetical protein
MPRRHLLQQRRLLPQACGFEGRRAVEEELLAHHPPVGDRQQHGPVAVKPRSARETTADDTPMHKQATVAEVDQFFRLKPEIAPLGNPALLEANALRTTAIHAVEAESDDRESDTSSTCGS